jgi:hypothetical protein
MGVDLSAIERTFVSLYHYCNLLFRCKRIIKLIQNHDSDCNDFCNCFLNAKVTCDLANNNTSSSKIKSTQLKLSENNTTSIFDRLILDNVIDAVLKQKLLPDYVKGVQYDISEAFIKVIDHIYLNQNEWQWKSDYTFEFHLQLEKKKIQFQSQNETNFANIGTT